MTLANKVNSAKKPKEPKKTGSKPSLFAKKTGSEISAPADEYSEQRATMSDSEAFRDSVYEPPSMVSQTITCYITQLKRFTKDRGIWFLIALILAVPVGILILDVVGMIDSDIANTYMATGLSLAPIMCALVASLTCGAMLAQEFNERTAFLSMPLPMSRASFYIGKFLAGFSLALAVILAVYGLTILVSSSLCETLYTAPIGSSILVSVASMFSFCCIAYMLSTFTKRGAAMISLMFLAAVFPVLFVAIGFVVPADAFGYMPCYGFDLSVMLLGEPPLGMVGSVMGFLGSNAPFSVGGDVGIMSAVAVVFGLICLFLGLFRIQRRDM